MPILYHIPRKIASLNFHQSCGSTVKAGSEYGAEGSTAENDTYDGAPYPVPRFLPNIATSTRLVGESVLFRTITLAVSFPVCSTKHSPCTQLKQNSSAPRALMKNTLSSCSARKMNAHASAVAYVHSGSRSLFSATVPCHWRSWPVENP